MNEKAIVTIVKDIVARHTPATIKKMPVAAFVTEIKNTAQSNGLMLSNCEVLFAINMTLSTTNI